MDNAGKTVRTRYMSLSQTSDDTGQTILESIKTLYNQTPGLPPEKIAPTVGQNSALLTLSERCLC